MKTAVLTLTLATILAGPSFAGAIYTVNIDTSSVSGTAGNLDFTFSGGLPAPPATTLTIAGFLSDGALGVPSLTGDATGTLGTSVVLGNSGFPPADYFTPFTYGTSLTFSFSFNGLGITAPDGLSGSSTFAFSMFDNANPLNPVLLINPLPAEDPGGFAVIADLRNDGSITVNNFMIQGTVGAPEPSTVTLMIGGLLALAVLPIRRALRRTVR